MASIFAIYLLYHKPLTFSMLVPDIHVQFALKSTAVDGRMEAEEPLEIDNSERLLCSVHPGSLEMGLILIGLRNSDATRISRDAMQSRNTNM